MPLRRFQLSALFGPMGGRLSGCGAVDPAALSRCLDRAGVREGGEWGVELLHDLPRRELALAALAAAGTRLRDTCLALPWIAPGLESDTTRWGAALPGAWAFALAARAEGLDVLWEPLARDGAPDLGRALRLPGVPLAVIGLAGTRAGLEIEI